MRNPRAATRESLRAATKTQRSQKTKISSSGDGQGTLLWGVCVLIYVSKYA